MKYRSSIKLATYLIQLAWGKTQEFDRRIAKEKNLEMRYYCQFKRYYMSRDFDACYNILLQSLKEGYSHWDSIRVFVLSVLPNQLKKGNYIVVLDHSKTLLEYTIINKTMRVNLYNLQGNSLYYLNRMKDLDDLIRKLINDENEPDHPLVKWYRQITSEKMPEAK